MVSLDVRCVLTNAGPSPMTTPYTRLMMGFMMRTLHIRPHATCTSVVSWTYNRVPHILSLHTLLSCTAVLFVCSYRAGATIQPGTVVSLWNSSAFPGLGVQYGTPFEVSTLPNTARNHRAGPMLKGWLGTAQSLAWAAELREPGRHRLPAWAAFEYSRAPPRETLDQSSDPKSQTLGHPSLRCLYTMW